MLPFLPQDVSPDLIRAVRKGYLIPLVGSGVSRQTIPPFPTWGTLLESMISLALTRKAMSTTEADELRQLMKTEVLRVAETLQTTLKNCGEYEDFIKRTFAPPQVKPAEVHKAVFDLAAKIVLTTNYDKMLEDACVIKYQRAPTVFTYRQAELVPTSLQSEDRPVIFKIHGDINKLDIIFSESEYQTLAYDLPSYIIVLSSLFTMHTVLMLGFSFSDPELKKMFEMLAHVLKHRGPLHYIYLPEHEVTNSDVLYLKKKYRVEVIRFKMIDGSELLTFINYVSNLAKTP
jgi:SIR2-like domain